jgi:hypothetical protein
VFLISSRCKTCQSAITFRFNIKAVTLMHSIQSYFPLIRRSNIAQLFPFLAVRCSMKYLANYNGKRCNNSSFALNFTFVLLSTLFSLRDIKMDVQRGLYSSGSEIYCTTTTTFVLLLRASNTMQPVILFVK